MRFDDESVVSCAGLVPVMRLAENIGLGELIDERVDLGIPVGANSDAKALSVVAGMVIGADSIDDLDVIRHGAMRRLFDRVRAPSTCGSWLRGFTGGHARQLTSTAAEALVRLSAQAPLLPSAEQVAFIDIDAKITEVYGHRKDGAGFSYQGV
ncbi:IS1380 family transposase, partial [Amycolatopsis sp. NPDC059657]